MVRVSTWALTSSVHHPVTTTPTSNPLSYRHWCETLVETLLIIANRYCRRNARFLVHSNPHRKFQMCAARVLIRPGGNRTIDYNVGQACDVVIKVFLCIKTAWNRVRNMFATVLTTITTIWRSGLRHVNIHTALN